MQTGIINEQTFPQILRDISQKRRHGILSITFAEREVKLSFVYGKIVNAEDSQLEARAAIRERLVRGGYLPDIAVELGATSLKELFALLTQQNPQIDETIFRRVVSQQVLETLYNLPIQIGGYYTLHIQMVDVDKDYSPSISVGQLLLDLVDIGATRERFAQVFAEQTCLYRIDEHEASLSEEEQCLFDLLDQPTEIDDLFNKSLLTEYVFQTNVVALIDQRIIKLTDSEELVESEFDLDSMLDKFASSVEMGLDKPESSWDVKEESSAPRSSEESSADLAAEEEQAAESYVSGPSFRVKLNLLNQSLLHANWVPTLVFWGTLLLGVSAPFFVWKNAFEKFVGE